jgi:energy-converting hydrogenase A subunit M
MKSSELSYPQSYNQEEIQKILELALSRKVDSEELTRDQLWEIGSELGIDLQTLQEAEQDWLNQKAIYLQHLEFDQYRREILKQKVVKYFIVNSFVTALDLVTTHHLSFSLYLILIWGLFLSLETWKTLQNKGENYEQAFQRWQLRQELKNSLQTVWDKFKQVWQ